MCNNNTSLCSTTDPYRRPVIEVAYGEMIFLLYRGCMGDDSSGRVVGVLACCIVHAWHTRVNTSVGSTYIIFWFSIYICIYIKTHVNIYVAVFKSICSIKKHWWSLTLSWPDEVQRMFSTAHDTFECNNYTIDDFHEFYTVDMILCYVLITISEIWLKLLVYSVMN